MTKVPGRQYAVNVDPGPPSRTPAGEAFTNVISQVVQLIRLFSTAGEALAKPAGQTLARWLLLEAVQDEPATVAQVARRMYVARQSVQRLADLLVGDGYAAYEDNPAHRRAKLLRITPEGLASLRAVQAAQAAWSDALGAELGEADLREASAVLDRVLQALRKPELAPRRGPQAEAVPRA